MNQDPNNPNPTPVPAPTPDPTPSPEPAPTPAPPANEPDPKPADGGDPTIALKQERMENKALRKQLFELTREKSETGNLSEGAQQRLKALENLSDDDIRDNPKAVREAMLNAIKAVGEDSVAGAQTAMQKAMSDMEQLESIDAEINRYDIFSDAEYGDIAQATLLQKAQAAGKDLDVPKVVKEVAERISKIKAGAVKDEESGITTPRPSDGAASSAWLRDNNIEIKSADDMHNAADRYLQMKKKG